MSEPTNPEEAGTSPLEEVTGEPDVPPEEEDGDQRAAAEGAGTDDDVHPGAAS